MSLSLTAFVPHSPMLVPTVGKSNTLALSATAKAYEKLIQDLVDKKIETIIFISPLGIVHENSYTLNLEPTFNCNFEDFGDLATKFEATGDLELAHELKASLFNNHRIQLTSVNPLDYGSSVPLFFIKEKLPKIKILPLYPANAELKDLFAFGQDLKHAVELSSKRIAVIASGSLSQRLSKISPAGYSPKARGWDKKIIKALLDRENKIILKQDTAIREEVKELGLSPLAIILGCLDEIKTTPKQLSYEYPFGVGLLVFEFLV
jgi:aromatic ring-opening dioxygenase LigB subunit